MKLLTIAALTTALALSATAQTNNQPTYQSWTAEQCAHAIPCIVGAVVWIPYESAPVGYRVKFTYTDASGNLQTDIVYVDKVQPYTVAWFGVTVTSPLTYAVWYGSGKGELAGVVVSPVVSIGELEAGKGQ